jgi:hypothetical protein
MLITFKNAFLSIVALSLGVFFSNTSFAGEHFFNSPTEEQLNLALKSFSNKHLLELGKAAADFLPENAQGTPPGINIYSIERCQGIASARSSIPVAEHPGLFVLGTCFAKGDLNVASSSSDFIIVFGTDTLSSKGRHVGDAYVTSVTMIDIEED